MIELARMAMLVTCFVATYTGLRTLLIWRRSRMIAELAIGTTVSSVAVAGVLLLIGAQRSDSATAMPLETKLGLLMLWLHMATLYVATWRIFRARYRWALLLTLGASVAGGVYFFLSIFQLEERAVVTEIQREVRLVGMTWAAFECFRYSAMLRKRVALGLADPFTAHRIWLWGMGASAQALTVALEGVAWWGYSTLLVRLPAGLMIYAMLGLVGSSCMALAFFPPAVYKARILRGADDPSGPVYGRS